VGVERSSHGKEQKDKEQFCSAMAGMQETLPAKTRQAQPPQLCLATAALLTNLAKSGCQEAPGGPVPQP